MNTKDQECSTRTPGSEATRPPRCTKWRNSRQAGRQAGAPLTRPCYSLLPCLLARLATPYRLFPSLCTKTQGNEGRDEGDER
ncbi:hypothetical protein E2C01_075683 [Portunus trituberculatus]|uniref:Uncharacterized protein n=1 Tax=Portunus trituberculatus TaxID=210409 RepID=A0A5B7IFL6_PORTR|nr:hypothetical protein [Portunus trituberculatus]